MEVLDSIQDVVIISMKPSVTTVITQRQRVFYHICALVLCLLCTIVPLDSTDTFRTVTMFHTPNTLMHIGLQPIVLAATICEWCSIKHKPIIALLCTLPHLWGHTWTHAIILLVFSWGLIHLCLWLSWRGVLPINLTLCTWWACTQYCLHPIAWICVGVYAYLRICTHNFPVVFTKRQIQPQAAKMSVLLHRNGPLLLFVRCVEFLGCLLPGMAATISAPTTILEFLQAVLISSVCLYGLQRRWPSWFKQTGHKIVTAEKQIGLQHFIETLAANAADILNPDIAGVGGLIDMIKISEMSKKNNVNVSPHCWNSMTIAASAMLHFCASNSNVDMAEIYPEYISNGLRYSDINYEIKNGFAELKDRPGLGIKIDIKSLMKLSSHHKQNKLR